MWKRTFDKLEAMMAKAIFVTVFVLMSSEIGHSIFAETISISLEYDAIYAFQDVDTGRILLVKAMPNVVRPRSQAWININYFPSAEAMVAEVRSNDVQVLTRDRLNEPGPRGANHLLHEISIDPFKGFQDIDCFGYTFKARPMTYNRFQIDFSDTHTWKIATLNRQRSLSAEIGDIDWKLLKEFIEETEAKVAKMQANFNELPSVD